MSSSPRVQVCPIWKVKWMSPVYERILKVVDSESCRGLRIVISVENAVASMDET